MEALVCAEQCFSNRILVSFRQSLAELCQSFYLRKASFISPHLSHFIVALLRPLLILLLRSIGHTDAKEKQTNKTKQNQSSMQSFLSSVLPTCSQRYLLINMSNVGLKNRSEAGAPVCKPCASGETISEVQFESSVVPEVGKRPALSQSEEKDDNPLGSVSEFSSGQFNSRLCIYAIGNAHMRSTPSISSLLSVANGTMPTLVWLMITLSLPFRVD